VYFSTIGHLDSVAAIGLVSRMLSAGQHSMSHDPEFTSSSCAAFHGIKAVRGVAQAPGEWAEGRQPCVVWCMQKLLEIRMRDVKYGDGWPFSSSLKCPKNSDAMLASRGQRALLCADSFPEFRHGEIKLHDG
jgi:hypothetical protein